MIPFFSSFTQRFAATALRIVEVGPRDGLQNEKTWVDTETKILLLDKLVHAGLPTLEMTSFVSPKAIPQMKDAPQIMDWATKQPWYKDTHSSVLTPNRKGVEAALQAGAKEIAFFTAASESFNQKNINCSIDESINRLKELIPYTQDVPIRGYVSCVMGCPYEGNIQPDQVTQVVQQLLDLGCYEISLGDTIGVGTPNQTRSLLQHLTLSGIPLDKIAVHFHDTYSMAIANIHVAITEFGIRIVDSSIGGLGGCPYAKGASGNVATEDVVYLAQGLGLELETNSLKSSLDLVELSEIGHWICSSINKTQSKVGQAIYKKHH